MGEIFLLESEESVKLAYDKTEKEDTSIMSMIRDLHHTFIESEVSTEGVSDPLSLLFRSEGVIIVFLLNLRDLTL